ncbi:MAG TPA: S8 family serine peptidase, partial [Pilimelia sp.]|nr:S8 family serine peptidase [Pilimelia sp.]
MIRRIAAGGVATAVVVALGLTGPSATPAGAAPPAGGAAPTASGAAQYTVVAREGVGTAEALAAIAAAGGTVVSSVADVGVFQVTAVGGDFAARAAAAPALVGAAPDRVIGRAPRQKPDVVERAPAGSAAAPAGGGGHRRGVGMDPLDDKLWGLRMVRSDQARGREPGRRGVTVGVLDTGLDASNPDLAANFSRRLSRNFAPDIEAIDGPCEVAGCLDPVGTDDGGHGTHVAGTIGAAANGVGLSGVAPRVTLAGIKVGQDSGYFFLGPVVKGLVYAANAGIDVVNMSFYIDPWLYNCRANPADPPAAQAEQRVTIAAVNRALRYAHRRGVTLVAALGNNHEDLGNPRTDTSSPNYGEVQPYPRPIDNATCWTLPAEGAHVIGVSSLGPSGRKSDFSNYGTE